MTPKILIIDDDAVLRAIAMAKLAEEDFIVIEAEDSATGIQLVLDESPDLVLLDVVLPDTDGYQICQYLRSLPSAQHLPIIMLTGLDDTESIVQAYDHGATDFFFQTD